MNLEGLCSTGNVCCKVSWLSRILDIYYAWILVRWWKEQWTDSMIYVGMNQWQLDSGHNF